MARDRIRPSDAERRRRRPALPAEPLTLVVDASVGVIAALAKNGFSTLAGLVAPPLMWSEARSTLHELLLRGEISAEDAVAARGRLETCPVDLRVHARLGDEAWRLAELFGWAKAART